MAHVSATFPPYWAGTGNVAYHNARLMHERGHEVTVFTARTDRDGEMVFPFRVERLPTLLRIGNAPLTPALIARLGGFDLIHLHYPYIFGAELTLAASRLHSTPLLLTYHNRLEEERLPKRALFAVYNRALEPLMLRASVRVLAVRRDHLISRHPRFALSERVAELPNGVDTELFRPHDTRTCRIDLGLPLDAPVALFVGALDRAHQSKNVGGLLRAFAAFSTRAGHLLIVGGGDLVSELTTLAEHLGIGPRVHFLGQRAPADLPPLYSASDVTVLPSVKQESFGLVLIESMACGTPVIATDLPGVRAVVEQGVDGLLVPPGDAGALTQALSAMLADPEEARVMGCAGRAKVVREYRWEVIGDRLEALYRETVGA